MLLFAMFLCTVITISCTQDEPSTIEETSVDLILQENINLEKSSSSEVNFDELQKHNDLVLEWIKKHELAVEEHSNRSASDSGLNSLKLEKLPFEFEHKNATFVLIDIEGKLMKLVEQADIDAFQSLGYQLIRIGNEIGYIPNTQESRGSGRCNGIYTDTGNTFTIAPAWGGGYIECNSQDGCFWSTAARYSACRAQQPIG